MKHIIEFFQNKIVPIYSNITAIGIVEHVFIFLLIFLLFNLLSKNNASKVKVWFTLYVIIVTVIANVMDIDQNGYILLLTAFVMCVIVMFSTEIKRSIWNTKPIKKVATDATSLTKHSTKNVNNYISEIIKALQNMSKNDIGAIIVLSNTKIPSAILDSGVKVDSDISSALIESIFFPKSPLHDGAIIIQNDKIQAAGCFLPLSQESDLPKELGTRHRAGIGVTEVLNVTAIIVSEETGIISVARGGKITRYADSETLKSILNEYYWQDLLVNKGKGVK